MKNKRIGYTFNNIKIDFEITIDNDIHMLYLGPINHKTILNSYSKNFSRIVEADYIGGNRIDHRGLRLDQSTYGNTHKYVSHKLISNHFGEELIITTKNDHLEIDTHFQFYNGIKSVTTYNVVKNIFIEPLSLEYVSSLSLFGISKSNNKNMNLYIPSNSWHCEAQWLKHSFFDLGIFNGNDFTSMKRFLINNTGSWSTKNYLPMAIIENKNSKLFTLVQVENNGSWNIELSDNQNVVYLVSAGPERYDNDWIKTINVNETFESVHSTLSFGDSFEEVIQEITKERRKVMRKSLDHETLPVIYNDYMHALWDTQTTNLIKPLVDEASSVGCDEFCIDAGWFEKGNKWWNKIGLWEEYADNFPDGGLKALIDYIKSKGLKAGIWIEIECVGINSKILSKMKDDWFFMIDGKRIINNDRYHLNFSNPEVYDYALKVIDNLMEKYSLDYLKIDYNIDSTNGSNSLSASIGDGLLNHNRAFIKWLNQVMDKYPCLTIENCGSGGCRMDSEILKYCPIQSTSDQTNFRKYPYLSSNVLTACLPEQAAVWSYPVSDYEKILPTDNEVAMNMVNSMLGRIHLASFLSKLTIRQKEIVKEGISYYKSIVDFKKESLPIYPNGISRFFDKDVVGGLINNKKIILGVWNTSGKPRTVKVNLEKYNIKNIKVGYPVSLNTLYSFDSIKNVLEVKFNDPYSGRIFEINLI